MSESDGPATEPAGSVRFIFEYDGDEVRLVSQQRVDVAVTGFDVSPGRALPPGRYVEVRTADGTPLAAVPVRGGSGASLEVFPEAPGEPITRTEVERPSGAFTVVLPAADRAGQVAVLQVDRAPDRPGEAPPPGVAPAPGGTTAVELG